MARHESKRTLLRSRMLATALMVACSMGAATPALAQQPEEARKPSRQEAKRVLQLLAEARQDFKDKRYQAAARKYEQAYELYPDPVILYRMGLTAERRERVRDAVAYYEDFVEAMPDDPTAKKVEGRLAELRASLPPRLVIKSDPAGAQVFVGSIDSAPLGETPLEVDVTSGESRIYVALDRYQLTQRDLDLQPGEERVLELKLRPLTQLGDPNASAGAAPDESADESNLGVYGWIGLGTGVALLATGGVFSVLSQGKTDEVNDYAPRASGASREELQELKDSANSYYDTSVGLYVAGGAVSAVGLGLLVFHWATAPEGADADAGALRLDVGLSGDGAVVGFGASF